MASGNIGWGDVYFCLSLNKFRRNWAVIVKAVDILGDKHPFIFFFTNIVLLIAL